MRHKVQLLLAAIAVLGVPCLAVAQKFLPKSIQFRGAPEYSDAELLSAAGLKKGVVLGYSDMQDYSKRLMDTGVFATMAFKFDGQDLIFTLTPSTDLYPIRLENLPLTPGADLDSKLHERIPLYHGKVPAEGGLTDDVRAALEKMLAEKGLKATVTATASVTQGKAGFVSFSIASPPVLVGEIRVGSNSATLEPGAQDILARLMGSPYDVAGSISQLKTYLGNYYRDKGYQEVGVEAAAGEASATDTAIRVPFEVSVTPGIQYRLAGVALAPDLLVAQADFDRQAQIHPGDIADGQHVTENWEYISRQYHNHGYVKASVHPAPTFDRERGTVSYTVTVDPGPVYTMGNLSIENVSDDLRTMMVAAWKMPQGSVFNEGAIRGFFATYHVNPALEHVFATVNFKYTMHFNDDNHSVDLVLRLEKKQ
jgi:outer membrane protein insertion porin family